ncbi:hypothetical protein [Bradyrhizobium ganzhouense]|uniref:hypothetical protein n=1 Tax=Bradyrhizobium ganzhouense TaxID=1179767 RepID=UPI003CF8A844
MTSIFGSGPGLDAPEGDVARQATAALRGYGYQLYASGLAWIGLGDGEILYLEVAEDYAVAARDALEGTQVKDTGGSANITLQSADVRAAIDSLVDLVHRNPKRVVSLHYLTTSEIGVERSVAHRIAGGAALHYWRRAAAGADVGPLRSLVAALDLKASTKLYLEALPDEGFRSDFLRRIHWDCGSPGIADVRAELEAGLIEYVASARRLSSHTGRAVVPATIERLLMTVVSDNARQLRRADLLELIDKTAIVPVPLEQLTAAFQSSSAGTTFTRPTLLVPASDLPLPPIRAPRAILVAAIDTARRTAGIAIASGATGLGKSLAARLVGEHGGGVWSIVDFRNLSPSDTAARLSLLQGELAASPATHLILDDVNEIDEPAVRDALLRVVASLRRRDCTAIVTSYRAPTRTTHHQLAPEAPATIEVEYLSDDEVVKLVALAGGDAKYAGAVYRAAARGHPQLTMATLLHLKAANWSRASVAEVLGGQLPGELGPERRAARQRLTTALSTDAQTLLLRASLIRGGFDRALALEIAGLDPTIALPGLLLDQLIGPWIETYRKKRLRVSPLLEDAAEEVLTAAECRAVHRRVADSMMRNRDISVLDASAALHHALKSEEGDLVFAFAHSVITCPVGVLDVLAPFVGELLIFGTDTPIFPRDLAASAMLRLAQLLALIPYGTSENARAAWNAFERERVHLKGPELIEGFALSKLLLHPRTGELFPDWLEILLRFDRLLRSSPKLAEANRNFSSPAGGDPHVSGVLFAAQLGNIRSVARFKEILERLDGEEPATRDQIFSSFQPGRGDISILVNQAWLKESRAETFDWEAAARDYAACADLAMRWGNAMLATRCAIAQAICIDENGDDVEQALACLIQAEDKFGFDIALSRARAKIHWRRRDHAAALPLLTAVAEAGGQDTIEKAHIAREAGISAATLGEWAAAQQWFERAQVEASKLDKIPSVRAMAIGLLADTAQAAYRASRPDISIVKMRDALSALSGVDAEGTLAEAYCRRVVPNGLLWLYREITGTKAGGEEEVFYPPGCGSNTEPLEAIREHPVIALDLGFYLLADADQALTEPTGFYRNFRDYLVEGPIVSSELSTVIAEDRRTIATHDPAHFVERVRRHASVARMVSSGEGLESGDALKNPRRGTIPLATIGEPAEADLHRAAEDYLLSFATAAALAREFQAIDAIVEEGLASPEIESIHPLLRRMGGDLTAIATDRDGAANAIWLLREDLTARPAEFCWAAAWLLFHVNASRLRSGVAEPLVAWIFAGCTHLVSNARFRLSLPATTVPPVEAVLARSERTIASAAELLLTFAPAAGTRFVPQARSTLEEIAGISPA